MKTPREILFQRHEPADSQLDVIRKTVLRQALAGDLTGARPARPGMKPAQFLAGLVVRPWQELIWSCRGVWGALGAVWLVIIAVNYSAMDRPSAAAQADPSGPSPALLSLLHEQRRLAFELDESDMPPDLRKPRYVPRPRSDQRQGKLAFA